MSEHRVPSPPRTGPPLALGILAVLYVGFTAVEFFQPSEPFYALTSLAIAVVAVVVLRMGGYSATRLRIGVAPLSLRGGLLLLAATLLMLPILGSSTGFVGWRWLPALVYAPASGIAQELFFRAALLPALERATGGRGLLALAAHATLFVMWHLRTFTLLPSLAIGLVVTTVLFSAGMAWGGQVQRDGTVVWSIAQHSAFLVVMSMFDWA